MEGADCYNAHSSLLLFNTTRNGRSTAEARASAQYGVFRERSELAGGPQSTVLCCFEWLLRSFVIH